MNKFSKNSGKRDLWVCSSTVAQRGDPSWLRQGEPSAKLGARNRAKFWGRAAPSSPNPSAPAAAGRKPHKSSPFSSACNPEPGCCCSPPPASELLRQPQGCPPFPGRSRTVSRRDGLDLHPHLGSQERLWRPLFGSARLGSARYGPPGAGMPLRGRLPAASPAARQPPAANAGQGRGGKGGREPGAPQPQHGDAEVSPPVPLGLWPRRRRGHERGLRGRWRGHARLPDRARPRDGQRHPKSARHGWLRGSAFVRSDRAEEGVIGIHFLHFEVNLNPFFLLRGTAVGNGWWRWGQPSRRQL